LTDPLRFARVPIGIFPIALGELRGNRRIRSRNLGPARLPLQAITLHLQYAVKLFDFISQFNRSLLI
jgi:hypothetical protein